MPVFLLLPLVLVVGVGCGFLFRADLRDFRAKKESIVWFWLFSVPRLLVGSVAMLAGAVGLIWSLINGDLGWGDRFPFVQKDLLE